MNYESPKFQEFTLPGVRHIDAPDAYTLVMEAKASLIDLREEDEYEEGVPDASNVHFFPLSRSVSWAPEFKNKPCIIMCAHGIRSVRVCEWLAKHGFDQIMSLDGGFEQWQHSGLPVRNA